MKVLVVHNYYSVAGGEDVVFHAELKQLKLLLGNENVWEYTVSNANISKWAVIKSLFFFNKECKKIYELVKQHKIDIVHIHNFFPLLSAHVFKAAKIAGASVVHTLHNYRWHCISGNFYRDKVGICTLCATPGNGLSGIRYKCYRNSFLQSILAKSAYLYYIKSGFLKNIDRFFVLTQFQKAQVIQLGIPETKIVLKPNMLFEAAKVSNTTKRGFLFVGRLDHSKGIELLLKTWIHLPDDFYLTVVGSGVLEDYLKENYLRQNIEFRGELTANEVLQLMSNAKFTIQPSLLYETFGLTIIESMSVGTPVIGFNIGTRPELIEDGKTGFITDIENLKDTLRKAHVFEGYENLSKNAITFSNSFSSTILMKQQLAIYESLIKN